MRVPAFLRRERPAAAAPVSAAEPAGLDAFATEAPAPAAPDGSGNGAPRPSAVQPLTLLLAAVIVLQAVPSALWLRQRLSKSAAAVASAAAPPVSAASAPLPPPVAVTTPCEPPAAATGPAAVDPKPAAAVPAAAPAEPAAAAKTLVAGMVSVTAPVALRVFSNGRLVGTTEAESIMLPVGTHQLEFVNEAVGYRARQSVTVQAARTTGVRLDPPAGELNVNAVPWAEVWIDNRRIGETPIGNLSVPIGQREVVFRHPELGERRTTVLVTLKDAARISMDLRKK